MLTIFFCHLFMCNWYITLFRCASSSQNVPLLSALETLIEPLVHLSVNHFLSLRAHNNHGVLQDIDAHTHTPIHNHSMMANSATGYMGVHFE